MFVFDFVAISAAVANFLVAVDFGAVGVGFGPATLAVAAVVALANTVLVVDKLAIAVALPSIGLGSVVAVSAMRLKELEEEELGEAFAGALLVSQVKSLETLLRIVDSSRWQSTYPLQRGVLRHHLAPA